MPRLKALTGIILSGGKSTRMGENKALIPIDGVPIIERIHRLFQELFEEVIIVSNEKHLYKRLSARIVADLLPDKGALGGLYTGLFFSSFHHAFCVACDMPFLNGKLIEYLAGKTPSTTSSFRRHRMAFNLSTLTTPGSASSRSASPLNRTAIRSLTSTRRSGSLWLTPSKFTAWTLKESLLSILIRPRNSIRSREIRQAPAVSKKILLPTLLIVLFAVVAAHRVDSKNLPEDEQLILVGMGAYQDGFYDIAEKQFSRFVREYARHAKAFEVYYLLAKTLFIKERFAESKSAFQKVILDGKQVEFLDYAFLGLAEAEIRLDDLEGARKALLILVQRFPKSEWIDQVYYRLGLLELGANRLAPAKQFLQEGLRSHPKKRASPAFFILAGYSDLPAE